MRVYEGVIKNGHCFVYCDGKPLNPRLDLMNHSPSGYAWGYLGSGPAQLALALLADALGDDRKALGLYQLYKTEFIARLAQNEPWTKDEMEIRLAAKTLEGTDA